MMGPRRSPGAARLALKLFATAIVLTVGAIGVAVAAGVDPRLGFGSGAGAGGPFAAQSGGERDGMALASSARGAVRIANSRAGGAVFSASGMLPGSTASGQVRIANPNDEPLGLSLGLRRNPTDLLGRTLRMEVRDPGLSGDTVLYRGPMASMPRLPLGPLRPGAARRLQFQAQLPAGAGNALQGRSTSVDLVWGGRTSGPPPECRIRAMRARLFVFRNRNVIRLVSRYRARVGGRVAIDFYERRRGGRRGRKVGTLVTRFARSPRKWKMNRVAQVRPPAEMRRFRHSRTGYIATLRVGRAPGYCRQYLNLDLVQLRRFFRQFVWFQRGSFQTRRPGR